MKKIVSCCLIFFFLIPSVVSADTVWIREYLINQGYEQSDISFNNSTKTIYLKGKEFYKSKPIDGKMYGDSDIMNDALKEWEKGNFIRIYEQHTEIKALQ